VGHFFLPLHCIIKWSRSKWSEFDGSSLSD